jgi:hypothetical protein
MSEENQLLSILIGCQYVRKPRPTTCNRKSTLASQFVGLPAKAERVLWDAGDVGSHTEDTTSEDSALPQAVQMCTLVATTERS